MDSVHGIRELLGLDVLAEYAPEWVTLETALLAVLALHGTYSLVLRPRFTRIQSGSQSSAASLIAAILAAVFAVVGAKQDLVLATRMLPWAIEFAHVVNVQFESVVERRFRAAMNGAIASALFLTLSLCDPQRQQEPTASSGPSMAVTVPALLLLGFLSFPQAPDQVVDDRPVDRQNTGSVLEFLTFSWPRKVFQLSNLEDNKLAALPGLPVQTRAQHGSEEHQQISRQLSSRSLGYILARQYIGPLALQWSVAIVGSFVGLLPDFVTYRFLQWLGGSPERTLSHGLQFAVMLGLAKLAPVFVQSWLKWIGASMIHVPMRGAISSLVYQKFLSLPNSTFAENGKAGAKTTLSSMSTTGTRATGIYTEGYKIVSSLAQLVSTSTALVSLLGWQPVAAAVVCSLLITPVTARGMQQWATMLGKEAEFGKQRSNILGDALQAIRQIKLSAAEPHWKKKIGQARQQELDQSAKISRLMFFLVLVANISPMILSGLPVYIYTLQGNTLTAPVAFTCVSLFKELESKLFAIPHKLPHLKSSWRSVKELEAFFKRQDIDQSAYTPSTFSSLNGATVAWYSDEAKDAFTLNDMHAEFPPGKLSIVTGKTGSGKSLILSALAREARVLSGTISCPSGKPQEREKAKDDWLQAHGVALVSQSPWMANATIQDNILFGLPMDRKRYSHVLYCCALDKDLSLFADGDATVISIKGVSLSGGQRSRIGLARAMYSQATTLLLDDVLSAVDAEVREWIVKKALCGSLARGRTRILVTHHVDQVLPRASYRLEIANQEARGEVLPEISPAKEFDDEDLSIAVPDVEEVKAAVKADEREPRKEYSPKTTQEDTSSQLWKSCVIYFFASGGIINWSLALLFNVADNWIGLYQSKLLAKWVASQAATAAHSVSPGAWYLIISALDVFMIAAKGPAWNTISMTGSKALFNDMINHIFGAKLQWLESTSHGEILTRFGTDMKKIDDRVCNDLSFMITSTGSLSTILLASASFSVYEMPFIAALLYVYVRVGKRLIAVSRCLNSINATASADHRQQLSSLEAPDGFLTVRAYSAEKHFVKQENKLIDDSESSSWHVSLCESMMDLHLGLLGVTYIALSCLFIVLGGVSAGAAGVALVFANKLSARVKNALSRVAGLQANLKCVENVASYNEIEQESLEGCKITDEWPRRGELEAFMYSATYRKGLRPALKDLSFVVKPGERVGVVGRTGAGKSTLALSFVRLVDKLTGQLLIDGIDVVSVPLKVVRKRILVIPQDPYLFGGTLRWTIDPDGLHDDEALAAALKQFGFFVAGEHNDSGSAAVSGLDNVIVDGGANLSQGQRQILCLVKAMLARKRVVIMDEATSAVDMETDSAIQSAIRDGLPDTTVIVIAHRLATVAHLDKVMVMDEGQVAEFGPPGELYEKKGQFWSLVNHSADKEELIRAFNS